MVTLGIVPRVAIWFGLRVFDTMNTRRPHAIKQSNAAVYLSPFGATVAETFPDNTFTYRASGTSNDDPLPNVCRLKGVCSLLVGVDNCSACSPHAPQGPVRDIGQGMSKPSA